MKNIVLIFIVIFCFNEAVAQVGVGTADPKSTLDINGTLSVKHASLTGSGDATLINDNGVYLSLTTTAANQIFSLPDATLFPGRIYILRNVSNTHDARIETLGNGVEFFAGNNSTAGTTFVLLSGANVTNKTLIFISDGSNWTYGHLGF